MNMLYVIVSEFGDFNSQTIIKHKRYTFKRKYRLPQISGAIQNNILDFQCEQKFPKEDE